MSSSISQAFKSQKETTSIVDKVPCNLQSSSSDSREKDELTDSTTELSTSVAECGSVVYAFSVRIFTGLLLKSTEKA